MRLGLPLGSARRAACVIGALACWIAACPAARAAPDPRLALAFDDSEARQALTILDAEAAGAPVPEADWTALFATAPYQWLKEREAGMGRAFTDDQFRAFLQSPKAIGQREAWRNSLRQFKAMNVEAIGSRVLEWLPAGAIIRTRVFGLIKPAQNSFVWTGHGGERAIMLYLKPATEAQFENTVGHEMHHIGLDSLELRQAAATAGLPDTVKRAVKWLGGFGEGEAMLAAAGAERHPHWEDDALVRARWDADMLHFNADLSAVQQLMLDILDGKLATDAEIRKAAAPFWGDVQGAWYTVGYEMAVLVERRYGRQAFDEALIDPRKLLVLYNQLAQEANAQGANLALWSPELLARLKG